MITLELPYPVSMKCVKMQPTTGGCMDFLKTSGVYTITDLKTKRVYIGSAVNFYRRWKYHEYRFQKNNHHNKTLQAIYNKDKKRLCFSVIEECHVSDILNCEQKHIDNFLKKQKRRKLINHQLNVRSALGVKRSNKAKENIRNGMIGRKFTDETKQKMREAKLGKKLSEETKQKMSETRIGKKINRKKGCYIKSIRLFTDDQIRDIRKLKNDGLSYSEIEKIYTISRGGLQKILKRQTYNDVV